MSESELIANDHVQNTNADRYADLAVELREYEQVAFADPYDVGEGGVSVGLQTADVPRPIARVLDRYDVMLDPASVEVAPSGGLSFKLRTPELFRPAGQRPVRAHGSSLVVTLTREVLDLSTFDEGDTLDLSAREGAILLTRHDTREA